MNLFRRLLGVDRGEEARRLHQQAVAQLNTGQLRTALQYWQEALPIFQQVGNRYGIAYALTGLGSVHQGLGDFGKALEYHQRSLDVARAIPDRKTEGDVLGNLGFTYH